MLVVVVIVAGDVVTLASVIGRLFESKILPEIDPLSSPQIPKLHPTLNEIRINNISTNFIEYFLNIIFRKLLSYRIIDYVKMDGIALLLRLQEL